MKFITYGIFWLIILITPVSNDQTVWNHNLNIEQSIVSVEWVKPTFDDFVRCDEDISFFSSVLVIQGYLPTGDVMLSELDITQLWAGVNKPFQT